MKFPSSLVLLPLILMGAAGHAELKWERPKQEFERTPSDAAVEARFAFQNTGSTPVTIRSLKPSCGCTTARLEKKTFAPGESGEVFARFIIGDRKGLRGVTVSVTTDEPGAAPKVLELLVYIQEPVKLTPALVWWRTGESPEAKTVQFTAEPGEPVHVKSLTSSNPRLAVSFETVKPGIQYTISVKPVDTTRKESAEIGVITDFPSDSPRTYVIHARIK